MPVPLLQRLIDEVHFEELLLYRRLYTWDPIGWEQAGRIAATAHNLLVTEEHRLKTWEDYVPGTVYHEPQVQTDEEIAEALQFVLPVG